MTIYAINITYMSSAATVRQGPGGGVDLSFDAAIDTKDDALLTFLDVDRFEGGCFTQSLIGFRAVVIGAGPAGLVFARAVAAHGAEVLVLEQAGDPRGDDPGYTNRSFNITLDNVGRQVLGDPRAYRGGIWLTGRAVHNFSEQNAATYGAYGDSSERSYVGLPRPVLRQNLAMLAEEAGARLAFRVRVIGADCNKGAVTYLDAAGQLQKVCGDLVVFGDGLHSLANEKLGDAVNIRPEEKSYFACMIPAEANAGLSLRHIHLWHEPSDGAYTFGIPNADGTFGLLAASNFSGLAEKEHPYPTVQEARERFRRDFPSLYMQAPFLVEQLPQRRRGKLWYKHLSQYRVDDKGIVIGEAACSIPYWAGYGANYAMYGAASLAFQLAEHAARPEEALQIYERQQLTMTQLLMAFVKEQGDFLSSDEVVQDPSGRSEDGLGLVIEQGRLAEIEVKKATI
jgi:flavin-dependent dehydrogenase